MRRTPLAPIAPSLVVRETAAAELMDDPGCDPELLRATYRRFRSINALVAGWRPLYRSRLRPLLAASARPVRLLDIGFGGGDVPRALAGWARRDGLALEITAIDPDARAHAFVSSRPSDPGVRFRVAASADLVSTGEHFDVVTSNHLLHHLDPPALAALLADSAALAPVVLHSDIERARLAYLAYRTATRPIAASSFVHYDGSLSVRRSYTAPELRAAVPAGWRVERPQPFRLLLSRDPA